MLRYIAKRLVFAIPTLFAVSIMAFIIIQLPPGDYLTTLMADWASQGGAVEAGTVAAMRERYGLDQPIYVQYCKWIAGILLRGDFGMSFELGKPVTELIWERIGSRCCSPSDALLRLGDRHADRHLLGGAAVFDRAITSATFLAFFGLAVPNFLLALVAMYVIVGLVRAERRRAVLARIYRCALEPRQARRPRPAPLDAGDRHRPRHACGLVRIMRANLLDELYKPYVTTARAKGLSEFALLLQVSGARGAQPVRSRRSAGCCRTSSRARSSCPSCMSLPTAGPLLLRALMTQDMYLAGAFILLISCSRSSAR